MPETPLNIPENNDNQLSVSNEETWSQLTETEQDATLEGYTSESCVFKGPLPTPELLSGYEEVMPGSTKAFFNMAWEQQQHRFGLEKATVDMNRELVKNGRIGQYIGALLVVILTIAGTICAVMGRESVAQAIFITTIIGVAGIFVVDRISPLRKKSEKPES